MEKIAEKTEKDTGSMHVITIVTLLFLPGTFFAVRHLLAPCFQRFVRNYRLTPLSMQSLLQSGVFELKQVDLGESSWKLNGGVFNLFIVITVTAMIVTFLVWLVVYKCGRRRSRRMPQNDVEAAMFVGGGVPDKPLAE